eukprot:1139423-Pelagomonas_calceolata.AAC.1
MEARPAPSGPLQIPLRILLAMFWRLVTISDMVECPHPEKCEGHCLAAHRGDIVGWATELGRSASLAWVWAASSKASQ